MDPAGVDITQRISSGIYQGNPDYGVTTAKGWPINGEWTHLIAATHNNKGKNHSMQIAGHFFTQRFFARNTSNNGATPWVELLLTEACWSRYQKRGFVFGYISHYEGMETGDIVARVVEGRVNKVNVVHVDDEGNPRKGKGEVAPDIILREQP